MLIIAVVMIAIITSIGALSKSCEKAPPDKTSQIVIQPENAVAQMEKSLGPGWEKIEIKEENKWCGPYPVRGGSNWKIGQGEIYTKAGGKIYKDGPGVYISLSNVKKISFLSKKGKGVIFLKY